MTPLELQFLKDLRRRGQVPDMAVFVTDDWAFADSMDDIGTLMIRVQNSGDQEHDWSPLAWLFVILWLKNPTAANLESFLRRIEACKPSQIWYREHGRLRVA